ncbi:MAG: hypothetical protein ACNA8R_07960 [Nitriliruptoraceae bacterium]
MAADRRTLTIGAIAMVLLILVGVVSGALFARSACSDIGPNTVAGPVAGSAPGLLRDTAPGLDAEERTRWLTQLEELEQHLGPVTGIAQAPGAGRLAATGLGPVALGETIVQLDPAGGRVRAAIEVGSGTVVGGGDHLYSLALTNLLTGQVDALQPLDGDLGGMTCVDTALVGSPLAFHLDAADGQLLLLRIEEDGDDAELELRDPIAGRVWAAELALPAAPAGLAGARLTAGLGPDVIVTGTRTGPGEEGPVLTAVSREDGSPRWQLTRDQLLDAGAALAVDGPTRAEVQHVGEDLALIGLRDVEGAGRADEEAEQDALSALRYQVVGLGLSDGALRFAVDLPVTERIVSATGAGDVGLLVTVDAGQGRTLVREVALDRTRLLDEGELRGPVLDDLDRTAASSRGAVGSAVLPWPGGAATLADGRRVVVTGVRVLVLAPDTSPEEMVLAQVELPATAVATHAGAVSLLLLGPDGDRSVVTFAG